MTLVIVRDDLVQVGRDDIPTMLQYRMHVKAGSMFNTPPTLGIFILGEVLRWIEDFGGLEKMAAHNEAKARMLYDFLDAGKFFRGTAQVASRSLMNVCFRSPNEDLDGRFIQEMAQEGLVGLKGHRSVGGMRASIYNAFPVSGVEKLVALMGRFQQEHGS